MLGDMQGEFKVTGVDRNGKRFRILTSSFLYWSGINVWRGTKWTKLHGKWRVYERIWN